MCGITGILPFNLAGRVHMINLSKATHSLSHRGPDTFGTHIDEDIGLGHRRLSIIDLSEEGNQPLWDNSKRYTIVFNGEIYNFKEIKSELLAKGITFHSHTDTEVLLNAWIVWGKAALEKLNGFFAFAIYDTIKKSLFLARDRFGIKPLYYLFDEDKFVFASEMQSILHYGIDKEIDVESLSLYFQLNYIPAPETIFRNVKSLLPGHCITVEKKELTIEIYYQLQYDRDKVANNPLSYDDQQQQLKDVLEKSVQRRLISDVPLGSFLSGGIDSSVITGIAKKFKPDLHTFSIGYSDEPFFDETNYANLVAKKLETNHTVFSLSTKEIEEHLYDVLEKIDQPFADSSCIPVYILSKLTKEHITVALSGDGADELFSGYNKHSAFLKASQNSALNLFLRNAGFLTDLLPQSRNTGITNTFRQLNRYSKALPLPVKERYWQWATLTNSKKVMNLLNENVKKSYSEELSNKRKDLLLHLLNSNDFNEILLTDMTLVLPNDMLKKVDAMSMANGLEVRVPFLDHALVEFVFSLPVSSKINNQIRKRILQDTYRELLPVELYNRPKHGFEVPLLRWFKGSLKGLIMDDLLNDQFVSEQGIFDPIMIKKVKKKLFSWNPGDIHALVWALIVFQFWWKKHFQ